MLTHPIFSRLLRNYLFNFFLLRTERFLLTAADQKDGSRSDRLARVIHAKFEAGLLRPYNHVAGYTRLMRWMADKYVFDSLDQGCPSVIDSRVCSMSQSSRQRTLHTLSEFRPAFRVSTHTTFFRVESKLRPFSPLNRR